MDFRIAIAVIIAIFVFSSGISYGQGENISVSPQEVAEYKRLAVQGNADAQFNLGLLYDEGLGVTQNYKKAFEWYQKAAEQGLADAQFNLGVLYDLFNNSTFVGDSAKAVKWYKKAAEQGHAHAQNNLGLIYHGILDGESSNYTEAFKWWEKAAKQGLPGAQFNLADCYYFGKGVERNTKEAVKWYKKAAEGGNKSAQMVLNVLKLDHLPLPKRKRK